MLDIDSPSGSWASRRVLPPTWAERPQTLTVCPRAAALTAAGAGDFSYLLSHHGMFSLLGLTDDQLKRLRDEHAVYLVARGRINMAGLSAAKIPIVAKAVAAVLA